MNSDLLTAIGVSRGRPLDRVLFALGIMFLGISWLASTLQVVPSEQKTVIAQVATVVFGGDSIGFYLFQAFTALILVLAANTSFAEVAGPPLPAEERAPSWTTQVAAEIA